MIDSHIHIDTRSYEELEKMALSGIEAVITCAYYPPQVTITPHKLFDYYERLINFETGRTAKHLIKTYVAVGINPHSVPQEYSTVIKKFPDYFKEAVVVGLGELGFDPASISCPSVSEQEKINVAQLEVAQKYKKPVVFHTPGPSKLKHEYAEKEIILAKEAGLDLEHVVIDHSDEYVVKIALKAGAVAGITVQPWRGMTPATAAEIVQKHGVHGIVINSDCSNLASDPLAVPRTVLELRKLGLQDVRIKQLVYHNPIEIFGLEL